jgi:hypothetical protein
MIDYKYPTIASGATPIGSAGRAPDEDLLWKDYQWRARKKIFESIVSGKHQRHRLDIYSHRESEFKNPMILGIAFEVEDIWSRSQRLKKSKIEDWSFETQPESATRIDSRGLLTRVCPSGTRGLVYWARPIMEVDKYKDSTRWLGVEEGRF